MFSRFNDQARRTVILAQEESRMLNHNHVGTEHLLLALARVTDTIAGQVLEAHGVSRNTIHDKVLELVGAGSSRYNGHLPFTPGAQSSLESAVREAIMLGHSYVGTGHLLLGLASVETGVASIILTGIVPEITVLRSAVTGARDEDPGSDTESPGHGFGLSA